MKPVRHANLLFVGLALILSLVSFSSGANQWQKEAVKTVLVIDAHQPELRLAIQFQKAKKTVLIAFINYFQHSFYILKYSEEVKNSTAFTFYSKHIIFFKDLKLQGKGFLIFNNKTPYQDFIS